MLEKCWGERAKKPCIITSHQNVIVAAGTELSKIGQTIRYISNAPPHGVQLVHMEL
jgi:hypothetical protein